MKETQLLGKLMPGHPDIFPIIENIREKYQIPPIDPENDIDEILLTRDDIEWDAIRQDVDAQVRNIKFFDDKQKAYLETLRKLLGVSLDFPELAACPDEVREALKKLISSILQFAEEEVTLTRNV
jgi:hypothetical protein